MEPSERDERLMVAVTGTTGLVGSVLVPFLAKGGNRVVWVVRGESTGAEVSWDPKLGLLDPSDLAGVDAMIHLAGENVAGGRWTREIKKRILESRLNGPGLVARAAATMDPRPKVLVCASAIGIYGDRGEEEITEESGPGIGFLPEVCKAWEEAADPARDAGIRVVHLRFGAILSRRGGALKKMLPAFRLGVGGRIGNGSQFMSWVGLEDVVETIGHSLRYGDLEGPVNVVSPQPVTNREFARTLGRILKRPAILPLPAAVVRGLFGEMGENMLLAGARVLPSRLQKSGFSFRQADLEQTLRHELAVSTARS